MQVVVPATETKIDTAGERNRLIHNHTLFVMRPEKNTRWRVLRMSENLYIRILSVLSQDILGTRTEQPERHLHLLEQQNVDLDALARLLQQDLVQPVLQIVRGPPQKQLRTQPPVRDEDLLFGVVQREHHVLHVHLRVDVPLALLTRAGRRVRPVRHVLRVAEPTARLAAHRLVDLVEPLLLLLIITTFEHQRSLQILDHDGVVGSGADFRLALERPVQQHQEPDLVVQRLIEIHQIGVFEHEPAFRVEHFDVIAAQLELTKVAVVDVVAGAFVDASLAQTATQADNEGQRGHAEQPQHVGVVAEGRIGEHAFHVLGQLCAVSLDGHGLRRGNVVDLAAREERPVGLVVLLGDVRARAANVGLDHLGQRFVRLADVLVAARDLPGEVVVREREHVHVRVENVRAVPALGLDRHGYLALWVEDVFCLRGRIHVDA